MLANLPGFDSNGDSTGFNACPFGPPSPAAPPPGPLAPSGPPQLGPVVQNDPNRTKRTEAGQNAYPPNPSEAMVIRTYALAAQHDGNPNTDPQLAKAAEINLSGKPKLTIKSIKWSETGTFTGQAIRTPPDASGRWGGVSIESMTVTVPRGPGSDGSHFKDAGDYRSNPATGGRDCHYYGFSVTVDYQGDRKLLRVEQWVHGQMTHRYSTYDPATDAKVYKCGPWGLDRTSPMPEPIVTKSSEDSFSYYDAPMVPYLWFQSAVITIDLDFLILAYSKDKCGPPAVLKFNIQHTWDDRPAPSNPILPDIY
jgi:hypothetical protein